MQKSIYKLALLLTLGMLYSCTGNSQDKNTDKKMETKQVINKTEEEWKKTLTPEQYHVLREKGTDRPFTGKYYLHKEKGMYTCAGCGEPLFNSDMKFDSDCGWPSFDKEIEGGKI